MIQKGLQWIAATKRLIVLALALLASGLLWHTLSTSFHEPRYYTQRIEQKLQSRELQWRSLLNDSLFLEGLLTHSFDDEKLRSISWQNLGFGIYVYRLVGGAPELVFWNTQKVIPPEYPPFEEEIIQGVHLKNGYYVLASRTIRNKDTTYICKALFPVLQEYFVTIDNLPTRFFDIKDAHHYVAIQDSPSNDAVHARNGKELFYMRSNGSSFNEGFSFGILLGLSGILLLLFLLHRLVKKILHTKNAWRGFIVLSISLVSVRFLLLLTPQLFHLQHWKFFQPEFFSIGIWSSSIGDLFFESLILLWFSFYLHTYYDQLQDYFLKKPTRSWYAAITSIVLWVLMTFGLAHLLQRMVAQNGISFNVTNFESVGMYSFIGFFILGILALCFYILSYLFLRTILRFFPFPSPLIYLSVGVVGLFVLSFTQNPEFVALNMTVLLWLLGIIGLLRTSFLQWRTHQIKRLHFLYWLLILSLSMAGVMLSANKARTLEQKKRFAEKLAQQADPKTYKKDALGLALFRQRRASLLEGFDTDYSYALYANGKLVDYYNTYPFPAILSAKQIPILSFEERQVGEVTELWYRKSRDKIVVIIQKNNDGIEFITLFAYLFSSFLIIALCYGIYVQLKRASIRNVGFRRLFQLNIRSQINGTILLVMLLSLVIMGSITIFFFINRYEKNRQEILSRTMQIIVQQVQQKIDQQNRSNNETTIHHNGINNSFEKIVMEASEFHGTDLNLYDTSGNLSVSSRPLIYNKGVLSIKMDPMAYYQMNHLHTMQWLQEEEIGAIKYMSLYHAIRLPDGRLIGYLNMPTYSAADELKQEISNFLVTLINLNAFIFLIAGAIALLITERITSSFTLIGQKMRAVHLGKLNQKIEWSQEDEIGVLVKEYNRMLLQLEKSAALLAKSEREEAWRQMARQVAHEIKNPLTPMRLSIQHLQKSLELGDIDIAAKTQRVAQTLVEQIDHLSRIAADFSQFAHMGSVQNTRFDFHEIAGAMQTLYSVQDDCLFHWKRTAGPVFLYADKTQINRLMNNLLKNALEARSESTLHEVIVTENIEGNCLIIAVQDNGSGIPVAMRPKIFSPNFTTKSSGTGLGLAMCKSIVEQAQGKIWFESEEGKGTTFYIRLPLAIS